MKKNLIIGEEKMSLGLDQFRKQQSTGFSEFTAVMRWMIENQSNHQFNSDNTQSENTKEEKDKGESNGKTNV